MEDRELLELAAKAAGDVSFDRVGLSSLFLQPRNGRIEEWRPLTDDGDALRLAAKLRLVIKPGKHNGDGCSVEPTSGSTCSVTVFRASKDMAEQMRHAIVRAAAEIGRTMP